jgi:hypothetical protein
MENPGDLEQWNLCLAAEDPAHRILAQDPLVEDSVIRPQAQARHNDKEQQASIYPMAGRIALQLLRLLVNPYTSDLTRCAPGDVQSNGNSHMGSVMQIC